MMYLDKSAINSLSRIHRINLINSLSGVKPALLVGTRNKKNSNLAIFSSFVHISSNPSLFGCFVRSNKNIRRHTLENIIKSKHYTVNHIPSNKIPNAHFTSAKLEDNKSEFKVCGLNEEYLSNFSAPFVKESKIKFGLNLKEMIEIKSTSSILIVGEVEHIFLNHEYLDNNFKLLVEKSGSISVCGLNDYYSNKKVFSLPYVSTKDFDELLNLYVK